MVRDNEASDGTGITKKSIILLISMPNHVNDLRYKILKLDLNYFIPIKSHTVVFENNESDEYGCWI